MIPDGNITALIIVDVQNDFCPGGSLAVPDGDAVVPIINDLMSEYDLVVATRDWHKDPGSHFSDEPDFVNSWPRHCVIGTDGADYHPDLDRRGIRMDFYKGAYSAAYSGFEASVLIRNLSHELFLGDYLKSEGVTHLTIVGLATDFCIKATALDGVAQGFVTTVLLNACRAIAAPVGESDTLTIALKEMREAGVQVV